MKTQISFLEILNKQQAHFYRPASKIQADYDFYIEGLKSTDQIEKEDRLEDIYHDYSAKVKSFILKNNGTMDDARELFQESLIILMYRVWQKDFKLTARLSTFLYGIWKNKWFSELRKRKPETELDDISLNLISAPEDNSQEICTSITLYKDMYSLAEGSLLTEKQKTLLKLFLTGHTNKEIAEQENMTEGSVAQAKRKLFKKLKKIVATHKSYQHSYTNWKYGLQ